MPRASLLRRHRVALTILGLAILGVGSFIYHASRGERPEPNRLAATTQEATDGTLVDYVGYYPSSFNAALGFDPTRADRAYADWETTHPDATVLSKEPVWSGGHVIGYNVRYRD